MGFDAFDNFVAETALLDAVDAFPDGLFGFGMALEKEIWHIKYGVGAGVVERYVEVQGHEKTAIGGGV